MGAAPTRWSVAYRGKNLRSQGACGSACCTPSVPSGRITGGTDFRGTEETKLATATLSGIIALRLDILSEIDASANVSFLERSQFRLKVFGVLGAVERFTLTPDAALEELERIKTDVDTLVDRDLCAS